MASGDPRKWVRAAEALAEDISSGRLAEGDRLNIGVLCARWEVSRDTVRKALEELAARGRVRYVAGLGWYVTAGPEGTATS